MLPRILIVAGRSAASESACAHILREGAHCEYCGWDDLGSGAILRANFSLIILHAESNAESALLRLSSLQQNQLHAPALAILPEDVDAQVLQLVSEVTADFVFSPLREEELKLRVLRLLGTQALAQESIENNLRAELGLNQLVGNHPAFLHAVQQALLFAASDATVLITGETGTGKELFAHAIHSLGRRRNGPFVPVDCGTLPDQLTENELFGHRRGAYTDAHSDQKGLAAIADGGTLFLDEIDALSPAGQAKLLRFLQEGTYRALGSERIARADVRVIAATNRPIEDAVRQRQFRNDLYFRINVLRLTLPPLRERRSDIAVLAQSFLEKEVSDGAGPRTFSIPALRHLATHSWPGNVRELRNTVQRAVVGCKGRQILPEHISLAVGADQRGKDIPVGVSFRSAKQSAVERFEQSYIEELLQRFQGNITRAAREAGKERRAFGRLVKKYRIGYPTSRNVLDDREVGPS